MTSTNSKTKNKNSPIKILALGGLGQIGMNLMVLEYQNDIIIIDAGIMFATANQLGIDFIIPSFDYLIENKSKIKAILITHGHEDHIGALPFLLPQIKKPIYAHPFTIQLIKNKLADFSLDIKPVLKTIPLDKTVEIGSFKIKIIPMNHSIPHSTSFSIGTSLGDIVFTGDFRFNDQPVLGESQGIKDLNQLHKSKILLLMSDSTNVEQEGNSLSEEKLYEPLKRVIQQSNGLTIVTCFASNIGRIKQVIQIIEELNKKVCLLGRSMIRSFNTAISNNLITVKDSTTTSLEAIPHHNRNEVVILCTGCQGEPRSFLRNIATKKLKKLELIKDDLVIFSSKMIPGNEKNIGNLINDIYRSGASVITEKDDFIHVSGHANRNDLSAIMKYFQPKFFIPIHGEYRHLVKHANLAKNCEIDHNNVLVMANGDIAELNGKQIKKIDEIDVPKTFISTQLDDRQQNVIFEIEPEIIGERKKMPFNGVVIVTAILNKKKKTPKLPITLQTKGIFIEDQNQHHLEELNAIVKKQLSKISSYTDNEFIENIRIMIVRYLKKNFYKKPLVITNLSYL